MRRNQVDIFRFLADFQIPARIEAGSVRSAGVVGQLFDEQAQKMDDPGYFEERYRFSTST